MSGRAWPVFDPAATCPKCGGEDISAIHRDGWVYNVRDSGDGEWIERSCRRCHYRWPEECVDSLAARVAKAVSKR